MRTLFLLFALSLTLGVRAGNGAGPGRPLPVSIEKLNDLIARKGTLPGPQGQGQISTLAEREAMAAFFAPSPVISETGDDIRKIAKFTDAVKGKVDSARAILNMVQDGARQISNLVDAQLANLPLGIRQDFGGFTAYLAIGEARLLATHAEVDVYVGLDLPSTDQDPIFMAKGVKWSRQGGFSGVLDLELIADWGIDMQAGRSRLILHQTNPNNAAEGCRVAITCEGLTSAQLDVSVLLSRDWVVPVVGGEPLLDPNLNDDVDPYSNARVHTNFFVNLTDGEGFFGEATVSTPFAFRSKEDVIISTERIVVDLSSTMNAGDMYFPKGYSNPFVTPVGEGQNLSYQVDSRWEGLYIQGVSVQLPENMRRDGAPPVEVGAPYVIIDQTGLSAHLYADNLLPLGEKTVEGWAFSVDAVDLKLLHNTFQKAQIQGLINVPLLANAAANCGGGSQPGDQITPEDCLSYLAVIQPGAYHFSVESNQDYCIPVFQAGEVVIEENSRVDLAYVNREFSAAATLHGSISVDAQIGDGGLSVQGLSFDDLVLYTDAPYFNAGTWDFPEEITATYKSFELGFRNIHMAKDSANLDEPGKCQLFFQAYVSFDGSFDLDATGAFRILGELEQRPESSHWRYRRVKLDAFSIYASTSAFTVGAALAWYGQDGDDPEWGSGFYGYGELVLHSVGPAGFAAVAQFGEKDGEKYFLVDVMAVVDGANILVAPGLYLGAIGGGIYKNMTANPAFMDMDEDGDAAFNDISAAVNAANDPGGSALTGIIGRSLSNKQYVVSSGGFGLFVQMVFVAPNPYAYSITGLLELEINQHNGWSASIQCAAQVMAEPNYTGNLRIEEGVGVYARIEVIKTQDELSFEATAEVFINVAGGRLRGINARQLPNDPDRSRYVGADGFAGGIYLKFSTAEWYYYVGKPNAPLGVEILGLGSWAYFCVGSNVPPMPPLPANVIELAGDIDMSRDLAQFQNAAGFAFGAGIEMASDGNFLIFYYDVFAGVGFDINIRNYGDAVCLDDGPNGPAIGVNGWYAAGQAWAYVEGSIGIDVKIFLVQVRKEILSAGVAAVLQLKGPNPTTGRGTVAGRYSILGGMIRGRFRIDATFGDNCTIVGRDGDDPFESLNVLAGANIEDGAVDVDPATIPSMFTTLPFTTPVDMNETEYRLRLIRRELKNLTSGEVVDQGSYVRADEYGFEADLNTFLLGETEYRWFGHVKVEKKNGYSWDEVKTEQLTVNFTTAPTEDIIPENNVALAYPYDGMTNLYTREYERGKIDLHRGQPGTVDDLTLVWRTSSGRTSTSPVTVGSDRYLSFDIPASLRRDEVYQLDLVKNYASGSGGGKPGNPGDDPHQGNSSATQGPAGSLDAFVTLPPLPTFFSGTVVYTAYIRTSQFRTFEEKIAAATDNLTNTGGPDGMPGTLISGMETFGPDEILYQDMRDGPTVTVEVADDNSGWPGQVVSNILPDEPVEIGGTVYLDSRQNPGYVTFSNITLYRGQDRVYFQSDTNAIAPAVGAGHFASGSYPSEMSGQHFALPYPKEIKEALESLRDDIEPIPEIAMAAAIRQSRNDTPGSHNYTQPCNRDITPVVKCLGDYGWVNSGGGYGGGGYNGSGLPDAGSYLWRALRGSWSTVDSHGTCQMVLETPVRKALKNAAALDNLDYLGQDIELEFTYAPPGQSARRYTKAVRVQ